ncbi:hypothetical protein CEUSTIGMA_g13812.t1, partial [Chlamydomonas eustigma]
MMPTRMAPLRGKALVSVGVHKVLSFKNCHKLQVSTSASSYSASSSADAQGNTSGAAGFKPDQQQKASQFMDLLGETVQITLGLGPTGLQRAIQGATAVASLTQEYALAGGIEPPQVVLRKLFERLGATYIKL